MAPQKNNYQQKLQPVIRYLEMHFKEPLNLKEVAEKAFLSPYHFHRIFKAVTDETLANYLRRLKLEYAAQQLFYNEEAVTEIALELGFSSSQSFAKAFRHYFGISATDIRRCLTPEQYCLLINKSKIGHLLNIKKRNNGHANEEQAEQTMISYQQGGNSMKTEKISEKLLAYVRVTGAYGENYEQASGKLYQWAVPKGLAAGESIFIYHDNPQITPEEKCRTDICIAVPQGTTVPEGIELKTLAAGLYTYIRKTVTEKKQYGLYWDQLVAQVVQSGVETDDRPCFELYHHYDLQTHVADVGFYMAIKN